MRQRFVPGKPFADTSRKGWYHHDIAPILILFHKNRMTEMSFRQAISPVGRVIHDMEVMVAMPSKQMRGEGFEPANSFESRS